jgi:hypothetical protein
LPLLDTKQCHTLHRVPLISLHSSPLTVFKVHPCCSFYQRYISFIASPPFYRYTTLFESIHGRQTFELLALFVYWEFCCPEHSVEVTPLTDIARVQTQLAFGVVSELEKCFKISWDFVFPRWYYLPTYFWKAGCIVIWINIFKLLQYLYSASDELRRALTEQANFTATGKFIIYIYPGNLIWWEN